MPYCILILRLLGTPRRETPHDGKFIVDYDPTWMDAPIDEGNGRRRLVKVLETTADRRLAKKFATMDEAYAYLTQASPNKPLRNDGKPNRPLTAYSTVIVDPELF